jgi:hypothetical protein
MNKLKKTLIVLISTLCVNCAFGQQQKVAVYVTGAEGEGINEFMGAYLVDAIVKSSDYQAVERTADFIKELNKEQDYQRTGAVNDNQISALGRQFGVQLVCVAKIGKIENRQFVSARLIDVETATVKNSTKPVMFTSYDVDKACATVAISLIGNKQIDRPVITEKTKQVEPDLIEHTQISTVTGLTYSDAKILQNGVVLNRTYIRNIYTGTPSLQLYDKGMKRRKMGNILLWSGIGLTASCITLVAIAEDEESSTALTLPVLLGTGAIIWGAISKSSGKKSIQRSVNIYTQQYGYQPTLEFGLTSNGVGFVFNF